jgi:hypothetical protein
MKKAFAFLGLALLGMSIPIVPTALGQELPAGRGGDALDPAYIQQLQQRPYLNMPGQPFALKPAGYDELQAVVEQQTALIISLSGEVKELQRRVLALEQKEPQ